MRAEPPTLVVRTEGDVLDVVPSLLGFHPDDSVVVLVMTPEQGVILTARVDLDPCLRLEDPSRLLAGALWRIGSRPGLGAIVIGYGEDDGVVRSAVGRMVGSLPAPVIFGAVVVGGRWWLHDDGPHDPGRPYDPRSSAIAAQCVYQGWPVLASRAEVAASLDPLGDRRPLGATRAFSRAHHEIRSWAPAAQSHEMARLLDQFALVGPTTAPDLDDLAALGVLARHEGSREVYWQALDRDTAGVLLALWLEVVRAAPRRWSVPPLCLLGMAAWQAGEGVLLSTALDRGLAISPRHRLVKALAAVSLNMLPPQLWEQMRATPGAGAV